MKIEGYFQTIGELDKADLLRGVGTSGFVLDMGAGRLVTVSGLTDAECRSAANLFMGNVLLTLAALPEALSAT